MNERLTVSQICRYPSSVRNGQQRIHSLMLIPRKDNVADFATLCVQDDASTPALCPLVDKLG